MKNFTNNFKQFTSRLSARWLIMALMILWGTSSAWADPTWACSGASTWNGSSNSSYYVDSGCSFMSGNTSINNKDFGTLGNTFGIDFIVLINDNSKTFYGGTLNYKVDNASSFTQVKLTKDGDYNGNGKYKYYLDIVGLKLSGGKHTITFYLTVPKYTSSSSSASDWYISNNGNNYKFTFTIPTPTYTISYNANGGSGEPAKQTKSHDTNLTLSTTKPTRTGYTFQNWNTESDGSGTSYASGATYTANEAATLYAQWTANTYTITYKDQGGENFSGTHANGHPTTHTYGTATTLKDPTKSGYNFLGWFTTSACNGTKVTSLGATDYAENITLYAKWEKICVPETSITSAELQQDGTIKLEGDFTTCGAKYHGFQWRKSTADWCNDGDESQNFSNYVKIGNTEGGEGEVKYFTPDSGVTYVFRTYIYSNGSWIYSTETKEVSTCVSVVEPAVTMSPANGEVCQGYPITLTLTTRQSGVVYKIGDEEIFKSTTTYSFVPETNPVTVTASHASACAGTNNKTKTFSISIKSLPEAPVFESNSMTVCAGEPFTLPTPTNLKVGTEDCIWSVGGKTTTGSQPGISQKTVYTAVKNDGCPSPSVEFTVNVTPIPTITASKTSCAPYEVITLSSAAGAGTEWSTDGGVLSETSGASVTFKAAPGTPYTVTASANGCTDTETITVECAAEDCSSDNTKIEILCKYSGSTMNCHAWNEKGNDSQDVAMTTWRGESNSTKDSEGYFKWVFDSSDKLDISNNNVSVIFTTSSNQSGHMTGLKVGKRYYFTYDGNTTATQTKSESLVNITNPTVTTVSAEQKEGEAAVVIKGFLQATGCADITKYGYQYRVSGNGDYTDVQETGSKNICEEWIVECDDLEYGVTYDFRAKATNEGGGKGYGDVIQVTIQGQSTPVVIKAVRNDRTVNESHWADFVALYVQEDGISTAGAGATKATKYTWEYSTDGTDWVTNFTGYVLGGASATVGVTNGSEKCNNIRPTKTGKYRVKVTYDNDAVQESNIITITSDGFKLKYPEYGQNAGSDFAFEAASRTIPVFVVKTTENFPDCPASGMPSQDVEGQKAKKSVDVKIFDNGNVVYDRKARMNYRGSSSLNFRKKSYAFCTGKEKTKNSNGDVDTGKENLFGLSNGAKDKDWVLYAAMPDPSMMRNRLIFDTYAQMTGKWGVDSKFVELIIDDEYMGVYVLMDKVTNNEKRINITAADGFILKFDKTDVTDRFEDENSEKRNTFTTEKTGKSGIGSYGATFDQRFEIEYPEMEDADSEEKWVEFVNDNVKGKIEAFEKALEAGNYTEVRKLIDYESWADWFIISEFAKNVDAYRASCYFVYNGDKIEARPLWDQELSFNNTATTVGNGKGCNSTSGLLIQNSGVYSDDFPAPFWFTGGGTSITGGLLNDPCFVTMVKNRYKDHLNNALSNGQLTGKISAYQTELTDAAKTRETNTWRPSSGEITACTGGGTGYNNILISNSISTMTEWITDRPEGLTAALDALTGSSINISIEPSFVETYPWEPFTLTVDAPEGYEYDMTFTKEGADATGNMVVVKGGDIYTVKIKRPANTLNQLFETVPYLATATLKVADDGCGGMTTPEANVNIRLNDRVEDECPQPSPGQ